MSDDILRAILAGNPARENTFASEELQMAHQLRQQQYAEAMANQESGAYGSAGATPNVNMHGEALEAAGETPPGQWLTGAVDRTMQPIFDPRDPEPYVNSQGEVVQTSTGTPAPWIFGAGGGRAASLRGSMTAAGRRATLAQQKLHDVREAKEATRFFEGLEGTPRPAPGRPGVRFNTPATQDLPHTTAALDDVLGDVARRAGPGARAAEAEKLARSARAESAAGTRAMNLEREAANKGVIPEVYNATDELAKIAPAAARQDAAALKLISEKLEAVGKHQEAQAVRKILEAIDDALKGAVVRVPGPAGTTVTRTRIPQITSRHGPFQPPTTTRGGSVGERFFNPGGRRFPAGGEPGVRQASAQWGAELQAARKLFRDKVLLAAGGLGISAGVIGTIASFFKEDDDSELPTSTVGPDRIAGMGQSEMMDHAAKAAEGMADNSGPILITPETKKGAPDLIPGAVEAIELPGTIEGKSKTGKGKHHLFVAQEHRDKVNNLHINAPHGERVPLEDLHVQVPGSVRNKEALYRKAFYTNGIVTHNPSHPGSYIVVDPRTWRPTTYGPGDARRAKSDERKRQNERNVMNNPDKYRPIFMKQARKSMSGAYKDARNNGDKQTAAMLYHNTTDKEHPLVKLAMGTFMKPGEIVRNRDGTARRLPPTVDRAAFLEYQTKYDARFDKDRELTPDEVQIQAFQTGGKGYAAELTRIHARLGNLEEIGKTRVLSERESDQYDKLIAQEEGLIKGGVENAAAFAELNLREERPGEQLHDYLPSLAKLLPEFQDRATPGKHGGASLLNANAEDRRRRMVDMMEPYFKKELADPKSKVRIPREFSTGVYGIDYAPKPGEELPVEEADAVVVPGKVTRGNKEVTLTTRNIHTQLKEFGTENNFAEATANIKAILDYAKTNPDAITEIESNIEKDGNWKTYITKQMKKEMQDKKGGKPKPAHDIPELNNALSELYSIAVGGKLHPMSIEGRRLAERERRVGPNARARPVPFQPF